MWICLYLLKPYLVSGANTTMGLRWSTEERESGSLREGNGERERGKERGKRGMDTHIHRDMRDAEYEKAAHKTVQFWCLCILLSFLLFFHPFPYLYTSFWTVHICALKRVSLPPPHPHLTKFGAMVNFSFSTTNI